MKFLLQQIINGLSLGMVYAVVAVGYSLIFGILRIMNMAHSSLFALSAHFLLLFVTLNWGIVPAIIISALMTGIVAVLYDKTMLAPLRERTNVGINSLITATGFSYVLQNFCMLVWGSEYKAFPALPSFAALNIGGLKVDSSQILIFSVSLVLLITLSLIVYRTKIGLAMRATEQNTKAANLMGVSVKNVITISFFISGVSAAIAGYLIAGYYTFVYPTMGVQLGTKAFAAAVLGGIGILYGSIVGGLIVGVCECLAVFLLGGEYRDAVAFIILLVILIVRPYGLFGKKMSMKV